MSSAQVRGQIVGTYWDHQKDAAAISLSLSLSLSLGVCVCIYI